MKSTGLIRRVDGRGSIVIPAEIRKTLALSVDDNVEMYIENDALYIRKYSPDGILALKSAIEIIEQGKDSVVYKYDQCQQALNFMQKALDLLEQIEREKEVSDFDINF